MNTEKEMVIGVISDTHGKIVNRVFDLFSTVDLIVHAGDIGPESILTDLKTLAPVKAVFGNMDTFPLLGQLKRIEFFTAGGLDFCITHILSSPKSFAYQLFKMNRRADVVIYGHTHHPRHEVYKGIHFLNPGSVSSPRGARNGSVAKITIKNGEANIEVIVLDN